MQKNMHATAVIALVALVCLALFSVLICTSCDRKVLGSCV